VVAPAAMVTVAVPFSSTTLPAVNPLIVPPMV
jgi:hypothetical protein